MPNVTSQDGTTIAYDRIGQGPALILILGAFNERPTGAPLAQALASRFTVINYDRRGRGESGDKPNSTVDQEIQDLDALIAAAGSSAFVMGYSSGAILAFRAAAKGSAITRLALYEPPPTGARAGELGPQLSALVAADKRGEAVELFQLQAVGIPPNVVEQLRNAPFRPALEKIAPTLVYESNILQALPAGLVESVRIPSLVIYGENSPGIMRQSAESLIAALPAGELLNLPGQGHDIDPVVLAPKLEHFFLS